MTEEKRFIVRKRQGAIMCLNDVDEVETSEVIDRDGTLEVVTTKDPEKLREKLERDPTIESVEEDFECVAFLDVSASEVGAPEMWKRELTGAGVKVAVIDTGIWDIHPAFEGRVTRVLDATGGNFKDCHYHGTHVAGIIGSNDGVYRGIAPGALIYDIRVLNSQGRGYASWIIKGMWAAVEAKCQVANMSLGSNSPNHGGDVLSIEANKVCEAGCLIVAAAGNSGSKVGPPGAAEKVLTVGATDGEKVASFSSYGVDADYQKPEVCAPGVKITSCCPGETFKEASGTSMSAPHVSGFAALLIESFPDIGVDGLEFGIINSCRVLKDVQPERQGMGKIYIPNAWGGEPGPDECPWCHTVDRKGHIYPCSMRGVVECVPEFWKCLR